MSCQEVLLLTRSGFTAGAVPTLSDVVSKFNFDDFGKGYTTVSGPEDFHSIGDLFLERQTRRVLTVEGSGTSLLTGYQPVPLFIDTLFT